MNCEFVQTELKGFPFQYDEGVVRLLNYVWQNKSSFNRGEIGEIGELISGRVKHSCDAITTDEYSWFGKLESSVNRVGVAVLFPWCTKFDQESNKSFPDRSIAVYSEKEIPAEIIGNFLGEVTYQIYLKNLNKTIF